MEERLAAAGFERVAGVDEVGRGALAGPLIAAAVILPVEARLEGLRDSKLCTARQRERLARQIHEIALAVSIVRVQHWRIDREGLQRCNLQALRKAVKGLGTEPDYLLIDGFRMKRLPCPGLGVKKADAVSRNVAAASIVAKVHRDRIMSRYHRRFPDYGFSSNKGYGTRHHWKALERLGPSPLHRRSFFGVLGFRDENGVLRPHGARQSLQEEGLLEDLEEAPAEDLQDLVEERG
ncbi:MAG: ribonuclease HII [Actinobacteria bacterium]|nr:ribonuclease HII [Actinomycetota bacterium]